MITGLSVSTSKGHTEDLIWLQWFWAHAQLQQWYYWHWLLTQISSSCQLLSCFESLCINTCWIWRCLTSSGGSSLCTVWLCWVAVWWSWATQLPYHHCNCLSNKINQNNISALKTVKMFCCPQKLDNTKETIVIKQIECEHNLLDEYQFLFVLSWASPLPLPYEHHFLWQIMTPLIQFENACCGTEISVTKLTPNMTWKAEIRATTMVMIDPPKGIGIKFFVFYLLLHYVTQPYQFYLWQSLNVIYNDFESKVDICPLNKLTYTFYLIM